MLATPSRQGSTRSEDVLTDESILPDIVVVVVELFSLYGVDDLRAWHAVCRGDARSAAIVRRRPRPWDARGLAGVLTG